MKPGQLYYFLAKLPRDLHEEQWDDRKVSLKDAQFITTKHSKIQEGNVVMVLDTPKKMQSLPYEEVKILTHCGKLGYVWFNPSEWQLCHPFFGCMNKSCLVDRNS